MNDKTDLGIGNLLRQRSDARDDPLARLHLLADDAGGGEKVVREADVEGGPDGNGRVARGEEESQVTLRKAAGEPNQ